MNTPAPDHDDRRVRRTWWIAGGGSLGLGLPLALAVGALGGEARAAMAVLLLIGALSCGVGALYAIGSAVVDDLRGRPSSRRRPIAAGILFVLAAVLMAMVAGIGG